MKHYIQQRLPQQAEKRSCKSSNEVLDLQVRMPKAGQQTMNIQRNAFAAGYAACLTVL
jgi:organic hydroperoxide reductase OsmC/OhrA